MLLTVLVESAGGGPSRLGGAIQRGFRIFRQVFRGESRQGPGAGSEQNSARFPQNQLSRVVPQTVGGNVFAAVRQGTRGILANYLARNQIHNLAAEMRRRYAVRLMSGSARFYTGLGNRVAIFSFVGISFGGIVQASQGQRDGCDAVEVTVQDLFKDELEEVFSISENLLAADEETEFLVVRRLSLSTDSDVSLLNEEDFFEDDFEVIQQEEDELCLSSWPEAEVTELREVISLQTQQYIEQCNLVQKLFQNNADLTEIVHRQTLEAERQTLEVEHLKRELHSALEAINAEREEKRMLVETAENQREILNTIMSQPAPQMMHLSGVKGVGLNPGVRGTQRNAEYAVHHIPDTVNHSVVDMEQLRAEGGRVRGLKIHRKKRMKNK